MVADQLENLECGDTVYVTENAPKYFNHGMFGSICGKVLIEDQAIATTLNVELQSELFIVEFIDGNSIEIPRKYLKKQDMMIEVRT